MNRLILALAGAIVVSACSEARNRRIPAAENSASQPDLTLPDSATLASRGERPVSPVEQQVVRPAEKKTPVAARSAPPRRKRAARPAAPPADTATRAYAPQPARESLPPADTVATSTPGVTDTAARVPDTPGSKPDTLRIASADTARTTDTASTPLADTVSAADTAGPTVGASSMTSPPATRILPVGTEIHAALDDSIDSRHDTTGQTVTAHVMENVTGSDGRTLIAAGAPVRLTVTRIIPAKSKSSQGALDLRADGIALNGQLKSVKADVRPVPRELRGRGVTGSDAAKVGVGAAGGAVLGRVLGGNTKGAVIGGVVGAAGGAVVASQTTTRDVVVKAKTPVVLVLTEPLTAP
jgi:glycine zipper 2TM protein